jgi:hypothetical protein
MPSDQILSSKCRVVDSRITSGVDAFAVEPGFNGFCENNLEVMWGMQGVELGAGCAKTSVAPGLHRWVTTMEEMILLGIVFKAYGATRIATVPDPFGFLSWENAVKCGSNGLDCFLLLSEESEDESWRKRRGSIHESLGTVENILQWRR